MKPKRKRKRAPADFSGLKRKLLDHLRAEPEGWMIRTDIQRRVFKNELRKGELDRVFSELQGDGLVKVSREMVTRPQTFPAQVVRLLPKAP